MNATIYLRIERQRFAGAFVFFLWMAFLGCHSLRGGVDANGTATPEKTAEEEESEGKNWVTVGVGGLITNGDAAQFKQEHRISGDVFGGIEDMHYEQAVGKKAQLSIDGHAIFEATIMISRSSYPSPGSATFAAATPSFEIGTTATAGFSR